MTETARATEILLAEDNPGDVRLTRTALTEGTTATNLHVVSDGVEALRFLAGEGEYTDSPRPDLILLDLSMPKTDGQEVLEQLQDDEEFRRIPVVVLTNSESEADIAKSYDLNANAYMTKPVDFDGFVEVVGRLGDFWLDAATLPPN